MTIYLSDIWPISEKDQRMYKWHLAQSSHHTKFVEPLDDYLDDPSKWHGWQVGRGKKDRFSRKFICSLMRYYPEGSNIWLFGGIFEVTYRNPGQNYKVRLTSQLQQYVGRLKLLLEKKSITTTPYLKTYYKDVEVLEIFGKRYSGRGFPGYEDIDISFSELESLVRNNRTDWLSALQNVRGVYLVTDTSTGKRYVGSACGTGGIWSRWNAYADSGHGGNHKLRKLLKTDADYARKNFRFALLEYKAARTPDDTILQRETYWKKVLLTTIDKYGLNEK